MTGDIKLIAYGICQKCKKPRDREGYYCTTCLLKNRKRRKEDAEFYIKHGLCRICGKNKSAPSSTYCEACSARAYEYGRKRYEEDPDYFRRHNRASSKKRYEECKAQGICTRCRKEKAYKGRTQCFKCLEKDALKHKYRKERLKDAKTS